MGSRLMRDRFLFRTDLLHEYAHQWYGDMVTPDNWKDLWLNESFAMYVQIRWEVSHGWSTMADWRDFLESNDNRLRRQDGAPGAYHRREFGKTCVYYCGALMLDRLRGELGDGLFTRVLREWPQAHRDESLDGNDYIDWVSSRTGRDLRPFITTWLMSPNTPS